MLKAIPRQKSDYWNSYYASRAVLKLSAPSQFAAFVAQEAGDAHLIIEVGCGNGRDSLFFARHGFQVVAIDGSEAAISKCEESRQAQSLNGISFICASVGDDGFAEALVQARTGSEGPAMAYARFFLHAITDAEETAFFAAMGAALREGDHLAVEYRTLRDAVGKKTTAAHYRRYIEPSQVIINAARFGFVVEYAAEGFGFAKYLDDDAYVARTVFEGRDVTGALDARVVALADGRQIARAGNVLEARLDHYFGLVQAAQHDAAYHQLRADRRLSSNEKKAIIAAVNMSYLFQRQLEWGNHGMRRSFRFWSDQQKSHYVERTLEIIELLRAEVTPHVSFGFGSVLGMIRDRDFIPHDDDMDLIIALPAQKGVTFSKVLDNLRQILLAHDFIAPESGNLSHLTTGRADCAGTDIFVGFIDPDQRVSWFPSARRGFTFNDIFPTQTLPFFGGDCPIPRDPLKYLAVTYGSDWRTPIANWDHPWKARQYRQFL